MYKRVLKLLLKYTIEVVATIILTLAMLLLQKYIGYEVTILILLSFIIVKSKMN